MVKIGVSIVNEKIVIFVLANSGLSKCLICLQVCLCRIERVDLQLLVLSYCITVL